MQQKNNRWSKRYEQDGFAISIERHGESVTALITVGDGPKSYMHCFEFPELEDFFSAVTHDLVVKYRKHKRYFSPSPALTDELQGSI